MEQSQTIVKLVGAICKAQKELNIVNKDAINLYFKSKYADLPAIFREYQRVFLEHGLVVIQVVEGKSLRTTIAHESGEFMSGSAELLLTKQDPQGMGSAITYMRRYALASICGIVTSDDDDDGNAGSQQYTKEPAKLHTPPQRKSEIAPGPTGIKTAEGYIIDQRAPNKGGYCGYAIEGFLKENGKPIFFSTKDTILIVALNEHRANRERVAIEYSETANGDFTNYSITGIVSIQEEAGDAQG